MMSLRSIAILFGLMTAADSAIADQSFRDCDECPEMVMLPPGSFTMGSPDTERERSPDEGPLHKVTFARPFAIGKFEVTLAQFSAFAADTSRAMEPCFHDSGFPRDPRHPASCLTVDDAEAYAAWLSRRTGHTYRLPSEAEWEYAVRGPDKSSAATVYSFGDDRAGLCMGANTRLDGCDDGFAGTAPAGSFPPNAFGLHDLHGNVWEFTADCVTDSYAGAPSDGAISKVGDCSKRIIRGAGWYNSSSGHFRSANRGWLGIKMMDVMTGFRLVRTLP